jgi:3-phosphoshikimate 1-carboxyvinyltransferase
MDITLLPGRLEGTIKAIPSKSQAHRVLICAAFSDVETTIYCKQTNDDIEATADCLNALGAVIRRTDYGYCVQPIHAVPPEATLNCRESGSTLRFMLPIAGALGVDATFVLAGRLPKRPLSPLWEEMERMGCVMTRPTENTIHCRGQLQAGTYYIDGGVSSQFITGLLFAAALLPGTTEVKVTGTLESEPYIRLTQQVLQRFGVSSEGYMITETYPFVSPKELQVEGDWSNGAFFLAAKTLGSNLLLSNLNPDSAQGDSTCVKILQQFSAAYTTVDCKDIPDLVPILAVAAASMHGARFENIGRLRLKESDRVESVLSMLKALGATCYADADSMEVHPTQFKSCTIDSVNDHRIAMSAAIAATVATGPITILGADCVKKSYPSFWDEYKRLGGHYEQYIR